MTDCMVAQEGAARARPSLCPAIGRLFPLHALLMPDGTVIEGNGAALAAEATSTSSVIGKKLWDCPWWSRTPECQAQLRQAVEQAASGDTRDLELPFQLAGNAQRQVQVLIAPLRDNSGRVPHLSVSAMDITACREAEEALRRRAEEVERLLEAVPAAVWVANDPQCQAITGNRQANELAEAVSGQNVSASSLPTARRFFGPDGRDFQAGELPMQVAAATNQDVCDAEVSIVLPSGEKRTLLGNAVPLHGPGGEVRGCIGAFIDVTGRRRAEETLRQSEAQLRLFVEGSPAALALFDSDMRYLAASRRWRGDLRLGERAIIGHSHYEIFPEIPERWKAAHREGLAGEVVRCEEDLFKRQDGTVQWVRWEVHPWRGTDGAVAGIVILGEDITERKQAEEALRASEQRLSGIVRSAMDGIITVDEAQRIRLFNPAAEAMFGLSAAEAEGQPLVRLIPERFRLAHERHMREFARSGRTARYIGTLSTLRGLRASGEEFPMEASISQVQVGGERLFTVILRDITERTQAEAAVRESQARLSLALEAGGAGHWEWDLPSGRLRCDSKCCQLWGGEQGPQCIEDWLAVFHPEERGGADENFHAVAASGGKLRLELRVDHPQRGIRWLLVMGRAFQDENGRPARMSGLAMDVTERKEAEQALREAARRKDEFLAVLAHELRNPLAPIRNAVDILKLQGSSEPAAQAACDIIDRQSRQLVRLIDDLLDVNRISRGELQLRRERVALSAIVAQALEVASPRILAAGQELSLSLPPEPIWLYGDPVRLAQVFVNLLNNATRYTDRGGGIRVRAQRDTTRVAVTVEDTGIGIARQDLERIFDMFAQVRSPETQPQPGIGIGLALARGLVEMHGGRIEACSEGLGRGSTFLVSLPVVDEALCVKPADAGDAGDVGPGMHLRILVVDDEQIVADSMAVLLRLLGNTVDVAHDGVEAIAAAERYHPDVILLDIGMPGLDGYAACRRIREQPWGKALRIIALTGWGTDQDRRQTAEAGFDAHLVKPVDASTLTRLLGGSSAAGGTE